LRAGASHHAERHRVLRPPGRQLLRRLGRRQAVRPAGQLRHDVVDFDRARRDRRPVALADRREAGGATAASRRPCMTSGWRPLLRGGAAALVVAVIGVTFVLWGVNGPAYLVDLIAAYCF